MSSTFYLQFANRGVLTLEDNGVVGVGRITPRLSFHFKGSAASEPGLTGRLLALRVEVTFNGELLGTGDLPPQFHTLSQQVSPLPAIDVPLTPAAFEYLRDGVRSDDLTLGLKFSALFQAEANGCPQWIQQQSASLLLPLASDTGSLNVPHSEWTRKILKQLTLQDYIFLTIPVPLPPADKPWKAALNHLQTADDAYNRGDDAVVLQKCYAVFESLKPRSPKSLFDSVQDPEKKKHLDKLISESKGFLHAGRHVATGGALEGDFDVDHRDSTFALAQTKAWLSYLGRLLS